MEVEEAGKECYGFLVINLGLGGPVWVAISDPMEVIGNIEHG